MEALDEDDITIVQCTSSINNEIIEEILEEVNVNYKFKKNHPSNTETSKMRNSLSDELDAGPFTSIGKLRVKLRKHAKRRSKKKKHY